MIRSVPEIVNGENKLNDGSKEEIIRAWPEK
jgi:hypothetical protein